MRHFAISMLAIVMLAGAGLSPAVAQDTPQAAGARPLDSELQAAFEDDIVTFLAQAEIPGAAVAVVQGGEIVYLEGFGVRQLGAGAPVTPDTLMLIGSTQKSMTSLLAATLVDAGRLEWGARLVDLLPGFATADPELTERLTMADAFCACTGLPRRDLELMFNASELSAEALVAAIATIEPVAPFGESFQYSNQMYAAGGYALAAAAGAPGDDLHRAYAAALRQHVLDPIGMTQSTFDFDTAAASGNYAAAHGRDLSGAYRPLHLSQEEAFVRAVAPAGGLWSSAREMAAYLQVVLNRGLAPDGTRVVSADNLERTWEQRIATSPADFPTSTLAAAYAGYGLGWVTGTYGGQPMLSHTGATLGFTAQIAVWPEAELGIVVLVNAEGADLVAQAIQFRLAELLFEQPAEIELLVTQVLGGVAQQQTTLASRLGTGLDVEAVAPYLGRYHNAALGDITLTLEADKLLLDAGEFRTELRPLLDGPEPVAGYVAVGPPVASLPVVLRLGSDGTPELAIPAAPGVEYLFRPSPEPAAALPSALANSAQMRPAVG